MVIVRPSRSPLGAARLALPSVAGYSVGGMRRSRSSFRTRLLQAMRTVTAIVTSAQLLIAAAAPLAERADSSVAAVHMEQAGTSRHHAHGDFCAVCAASHLTALPTRPPSFGDIGHTTSRPVLTETTMPGQRDARYVFARAPPV